VTSDGPDRQDTLDAFKRFYESFRAAHAHLLTFLRDISSLTECSRFASSLLYRLIFLYFLQKQHIFNNNPHYLIDMLKRLQKGGCKQRFCSFYRHLLLHISGATPPTADFGDLLATVPRLNVALFDPASLEDDTNNMQIPDEVFEELFALFDSFQWQLAAQPSPAGVDPALLTYIFEKSINQKQMGAYYTKDDISEYISRNTILAYVLHVLQQTCEEDFQPNGPHWPLLRADPDRYISTALRHQDYLAAETEREYAQRRERYVHLKTMLATGKIVSLNDFITYNLNITRFLLDIISTTNNIRLLHTLYNCLASMSILDPTCGSGAFLFAAMNILTPLYTACLERMRVMISDYERHPSEYLTQFREILSHADQYADPTCFILKMIISNNLYGVDIMPEAAEICRLRLFLTLIARIRQPDEITLAPALIFHIRCGNTLVGFVRAQEAEKALAHHSNHHNLPLGTEQRARLDAYLASASRRIPEGEQAAMQQWRESHQPFHWCIEFHEIMQRGGFDVIIGNPPYVEYSKVRHIYRVQGYETETCGNLYAAVIERSLALCRPGSGFLGYIVPLSICGSGRFHQLRHIIKQHTSAHWFANFEIFPCRLFDGAFQRLSILLARHAIRPENNVFVTKIQRWYASERPHLIDLIAYTRTQYMLKPPVIPKLASPLQERILQKILSQAQEQTIAARLSAQPTDHFVYYQEATNYWTKAVNGVPYYKKNGVMMPPPHGRFLYFHDTATAQVIMAIMNSSLFYVWFATFSDGFHLSHTLVKDFPVSSELYGQQELLHLSQALQQSIKAHARRSTRNTRRATRPNKDQLLIELEEYRMSHSKQLIDAIDALLADHYGFTPEELDFIIHYDHKYRMGKDDGEVDMAEIAIYHVRQALQKPSEDL
jgi:methylase of polypeptide subunit release factors